MRNLERMHSYEGLRVLWTGWTLQGVYTVENYHFQHVLHVIGIFFAINIITPAMFVGQLFFVENFKDLLGIITMGLCVVICGYKYLIVLMKRRKLVRIRVIMEQLDLRPTTESQRDYMANVCKRCNRLAWIVISCYFVVNTLFEVSAALSHRQNLVFPVWVPYDWRNSAFLYWMTWSYQVLAQCNFCVQQTANDVTGPIYLSLLNTHLRVIMGRIARLTNDPKKSDWENCKELIGCIEDHRLIMDVFDILQGTVSYIIFLQFIGTALVCSMNILLYFLYPLSTAEILTIMLFLVAEIFQILPCCYFSNEFMSSTDEFVDAIYSSDWTDQGPQYKKLMIIFMEMTQQTKVIIAGKVIPVTLATFVSDLSDNGAFLSKIGGIQKRGFVCLLNMLHLFQDSVFDILQGTVSYTIFLQFIGTALVFCMNTLLYFLYPLSLTEVLTVMLFLVAEILQILPCCYFSNKFMSSTDEFVNGIYSTDWTGQSPKFKKMMIIFMQMTQQTKVIIAGKIIPVTLATFISIMKISYSMFTVASQFQ